MTPMKIVWSIISILYLCSACKPANSEQDTKENPSIVEEKPKLEDAKWISELKKNKCEQKNFANLIKTNNQCFEICEGQEEWEQKFELPRWKGETIESQMFETIGGSGCVSIEGLSQIGPWYLVKIQSNVGRLSSQTILYVVGKGGKELTSNLLVAHQEVSYSEDEEGDSDANSSSSVADEQGNITITTIKNNKKVEQGFRFNTKTGKFDKT